MPWTLMQIQDELAPILDKRRTWTRVAELLILADVENIWEGEYRSYTEWLEHLAKQVNVSVGYLWQILKAGRMYAKYQFRNDKTGRDTPDLTDLTISAEALNLCEKLGNRNDSITDEYVGQLLRGEITTKTLKEKWQALNPKQPKKG